MIQFTSFGSNRVNSHKIGEKPVWVVENPQDCPNNDFSWLIGQIVELDGRRVKVWGVEKFMIGGTYPKGKLIGLGVEDIQK
jgi:hypothetical protein